MSKIGMATNNKNQDVAAHKVSSFQPQIILCTNLWELLLLQRIHREMTRPSAGAEKTRKKG